VRKGKLFRDAFFGLLGTAILAHEYLVDHGPDSLSILLVCLFYGYIPLARADENQLSLREILLKLLGAGGGPPSPPESPPDPPSTEPPKPGRKTATKQARKPASDSAE
jgi:hypothetical protein